MITPTPSIAGAPLLPDGRPAFVLSADTGDGLAGAAVQLRRYLDEHPDVPLTDIAAALVGTRELRRHRAIIATGDRAELLAALEALLADGAHPALHTGRRANGTPAFVFPGQGSQRRGMGALFYRESEVYRRTADRIHELSMQLFGFSPRDYLLGEGRWAESGDTVPIEIVQPAIFTQALGLVAMWRAVGVRPRIHVGHSQGEIAAAVAAGTVGLADGLRLVTRRALAVRDHAPTGHSMAVLGTDRERCAAMLARVIGFAELSVVNSAHVLCISGERAVVGALVEQASAEGIFAREIRVEYPAHTSLVGTLSHLSGAWMGAMDESSFLPTEHLLIGGTLGEIVAAETDFENYWFWNLRNPVRFDLATRAALDAGADCLIEVAEHPTLHLALLENVADAGQPATVTGSSRRDAEDLTVFGSAVAAVLASHADDLDELRVGRTNLPPAFPVAPMQREHLWSPIRRPAPGPALPGPRTMRTLWRPVTEQVVQPPRPMAVIDPTGSRSDLAQALVDAAAGYGVPARIADQAQRHERAVVLVPTEVGSEPIAAVGQFLADRTWWADERPATDLAIVTVGAIAAVPADHEPDGTAQAIAVGFRSFAADMPGTPVRHLDLDPRLPCAAQGGPAMHALHAAGEPRLALRAGALLAERWADVAAAEPAAPVHRHVVISGGTGHLGLAFASHLAERGAQTITLLSRSGAGPHCSGALARIRRRFSTEVTVVSCDITDESALTAALGGREIDTVVHTAVGYLAAPADQLCADQFTEAAAAKVTGLRNLATAAPQATIIGCSSVASVLPGAGQAWYSAANALMEAELADYRRAGRTAVTVRWGLWEQAGPLDAAGFAAVTATGVIPMAGPDALAALAGTTGDEPVILAADLPRLRSVVGAFGAAALLSELDEAERPEPAPHTGPAPATTAPASTAPPADASPVGEAPAPEPSTGAGPAADLAQVLRGQLSRVLGLPADEVDPDIALVALGLDSLQALELRTAVREELDLELPLEAILGGATLTDVSAELGAGRP